MKKVTFNGELVLTLASKTDWIRKVPNHLPEKQRAEQLIWLDKYGNCLTLGEDFAAAEVQDSYPVKVYRVQRVSQQSEEKSEPETSIQNPATSNQ